MNWDTAFYSLKNWGDLILNPPFLTAGKPHTFKNGCCGRWAPWPQLTFEQTFAIFIFCSLEI